MGGLKSILLGYSEASIDTNLAKNHAFRANVVKVCISVFACMFAIGLDKITHRAALLIGPIFMTAFILYVITVKTQFIEIPQESR
jgi:diacylglycerol kinase